jgi:hypothetical protein
MLFGYKYPKLTGLVLAIVLAYVIFSNPSVANYVSSIENIGYIGIFIAGMLLPLGFTAPFAIGLFVTLNVEHIFILSLVAGFGAMLSDLLIFYFIRLSFMDEIKRLERTKLVREVENHTIHHLKKHFKIYLMYIFAGFIIASPLPDEVGVVMLAGLTKIRQSIFIPMSYVLHVLGILLLLLI